MGTRRLATPWWLEERGEARCSTCLTLHHLEMEVRCEACDGALCPSCVVERRVERVVVLCGSCAREAT